MIRRHTIHAPGDARWDNNMVRITQGYNLRLDGGYDKLTAKIWVEKRSHDRVPQIRIYTGVNGSGDTPVLHMPLDTFFECILPEYNVTFTKRSEDGPNQQESKFI